MAHLPSDAQHCTIVIHAEDVRSARTGRVIDDLLHLSDSEDHLRQFAHGLQLDLRPWPGDSRLPTAIPEVRQFIQAIDQQWPYWMHFLHPNPTGWRQLLDCILPPRPLALHDAPTQRRYPREGLDRYIMRLSEALANLHEHYNLDEDQRTSIYGPSINALRASQR